MRNNADASKWMLSDDCPFLFGQGCGFCQDTAGNTNHTDIMQQSSSFDCLDLFRRQVHLPCDIFGIYLNILRMICDKRIFDGYGLA